MDTPLTMELIRARAIIADVFLQNGFVTWSQQASTETDARQIRRLAIRAVNTTPECLRSDVTNKLIPLLR